MENDGTHSRRIFLCFAALTETMVEFGGLSDYTADHVDIVMHSYHRHMKENTNNDLSKAASEILIDVGYVE